MAALPSTRRILSMVLGCASVYAALFGTGYFNILLPLVVVTQM